MSGGATTSSYSSVHATTSFQGTAFNGGNTTFNLPSQAPRRPDPDDGISNKLWKVPRRPNTLFTGRTDVLGRIKKAIYDGPEQDAVFVITGLGGLGKSEICLKIAKEMRSEFWAVFWVDVSSPDIAKSEFINVAGMLGQTVDSIEGACTLLANTRKRCLLILDNADDPHFDYDVYLPSSIQGAVIMTSRNAECSELNTIGCEALSDLNTADCVQLLLKAAKVPKDDWEEETKAAEDVVRDVQSHTLALIQAGAYLARQRCTLADYHKEFQRQRKRLLKFSSTQARSRYGDVYATFEASAEVLSEDALDLLRVVSELNYSFLPVSLFESAWRGSQQARGRVAYSGPGLGDLSSWDVVSGRFTDLTGHEIILDKFDVLDQSHVIQLPAFIGTKNNAWDVYLLNEALYLLRSLSLITEMEQDGTSGFSMHPLVHAWARERQNEEARRISWLSAGCVITLDALGSPGREKMHRSVQTHIQSWADERIEKSISRCGDRHTMALVWSCSWMLIEMRDDRRLHNLLQVQFRDCGVTQTRLEGSLVPLYHLWVHSYHFNGDSNLAVELMEYVVEWRRETLEETHPNRLAAESWAAFAYRVIGKTQKAMELLDHVVKVQETVLPETHPFLLESQQELAQTCLAIGQTQKAVQLLEHVVKIQSTTIAETHPYQLLSQHELATAYLSTGKTQEAAELLEHVVKIWSTTLAETHPDLLVSQHALARAYLEEGKTQEAVKLLEHVVEIESTTLAETHPNQLASQHELAGAYLDTGKTREAVELLKHVVKIQSTTLAETHPNQLASQHELAGAYLDTGKTQEAVELLEHVVKIRLATLVKTHPDRLAAQYQLATAYLRLDKERLQEAIELLEHVVEIESTTLDETHPDRLISEHTLARTYLDLDKERLQEAVELLAHVVEIESTTLAETDPDRLESQYQLARAYLDLDEERLQEAIELLEHVVEIESTTLAETDPSRLASQELLAYALDRVKCDDVVNKGTQDLEAAEMQEESDIQSSAPSSIVP